MEIDKGQKRSLVRSFFKLLAISCSLFGLGFSMYKTTSEFIHDNIVVSVSYETMDNQEFPAVTICNKNPMECSKLRNTRTAEILFNRNSCPKQNETHSIFESLHDREYERRREFTFKSKLLNTAIKKNLGQSFESMIRSCYFGVYSCQEKDFMWFSDNEYGNCYTFGSNYFRKGRFGAIMKHHRTNRMKSEIGPQEGLALIFRANVHDYIPGITEETAMRIVVHNVNEAPNLKSGGINISPGHSTVIRIRNRLLERLNYRDKKCIKSWSELFPYINCTDCYPDEIYTQTKCKEYEKQQLMIKNCGCRCIDFLGYDAYHPMRDCFNQAKSDPKLAHCVWKQKLSGKLCKPACTRTQLKLSVSSTSWPTPTYTLRTMEKYFLPKDREELTHLNPNMTSIQMFVSDFGKILIYQDSEIVEKVKENEKQTTFTLISSFGGLAGLYVGLSFLSIYDIIENLCLKLKKKLNKEDLEDNYVKK